MVIGLNAVIHVILSHGVAVGAFGLFALSQIAARQSWNRFQNDADEFSWEFLKFLVITITIFGAVTGAGIWFTIGSLAPRSTGLMLRVFFWPWFVEWWIFVFEATSLVTLYLGWSRWHKAGSRIPLWLSIYYALLASISAILITGILSFMLTPGAWVENRNFWTAFLNPTFVPQTVARLGLAFMLGSQISLAVLLCRKRDSEFVHGTVRLYSQVYLLAVIVFAIGLVAYFPNIPASFRTEIIYSVLTQHFVHEQAIFWWINGLAAGLVCIHFLLGLFGKIQFLKLLLIPAFICTCGMIAEFERIREFIRGPYTMPGYMFANGVLVDEYPKFKKDGMLSRTEWFRANQNEQSRWKAGAYLFRRNCGICHTVGGINNINDRLKGRPQDGIYVLLGHTHETIPFMPPFSGNDQERRILSEFLYDFGQGKIQFSSRGRIIPSEAK